MPHGVLSIARTRCVGIGVGVPRRGHDHTRQTGTSGRPPPEGGSILGQAPEGRVEPRRGLRSIRLRLPAGEGEAIDQEAVAGARGEVRETGRFLHPVISWSIKERGLEARKRLLLKKKSLFVFLKMWRLKRFSFFIFFRPFGFFLGKKREKNIYFGGGGGVLRKRSVRTLYHWRGNVW